MENARLAWRAPEGIHGPLQLPVQLPALYSVNGTLQLVHLRQQGIVVFPALGHLHAYLHHNTRAV